MKILEPISEYPKKVVLILGFFDGVHLGHRSVIEKAVSYAKKMNVSSVLITVNPSPCEFFLGEAEYIFDRQLSFSLMENLGVDYLLELDFKSIVSQTAEEYLNDFLVKKFEPTAIFTGFNHSFGKNKKGNPEFLKENSSKYGYESFSIEPSILNDEVISSTLIKKYLMNGEIEKANDLLGSCFGFNATVIEGQKLGRKIGFPTANALYPKGIVKVPYGVYKVRVNDNLAVLNWGVKPTVGTEYPVLEAHLLDFSSDLYGLDVRIDFIKKIRNEQKFDSFEDLKSQIKKDIEACLKL